MKMIVRFLIIYRFVTDVVAGSGEDFSPESSPSHRASMFNKVRSPVTKTSSVFGRPLSCSEQSTQISIIYLT